MNESEEWVIIGFDTKFTSIFQADAFFLFACQEFLFGYIFLCLYEEVLFDFVQLDVST